MPTGFMSLMNSPFHRCFSLPSTPKKKDMTTNSHIVLDAAVKAFGGQDATKRADEDLVAEYEAKLAAYNAIIADLKAQGAIE